LRIDRVALENRIGQANLVPAQVCKHVLGDVGDALAGDQRDGESRIDQRLAELRLCRVVGVEMDGRGVLGEQGEPDVVRLGHRAAQRLAIDFADPEILEKPSAPAILLRHVTCSYIALSARNRDTKDSSKPSSCRIWRACAPTSGIGSTRGSTSRMVTGGT